MFDGLTISQLKICYELFGNPNTSFFIENCQITKIQYDSNNNDVSDDINSKFEYLLIKYEDNSYRILFYPVTLKSNCEPSALDLNNLLSFLIKNQILRRYYVTRLIIPIGEVSKPLIFPTIHHMVTLIIDILQKDNNTNIPVLPPIRIKIVDSLRMSLPLCHQTEDIVEILDNHFDVREFQREYINHQNILDRKSCCYFTLKVIQKGLTDCIPEFCHNIFLNNLSPTSKFSQSIPSPDSWIMTSCNWLTLENKMEVQDILLQYYQNQNMIYDNIDQIIDDIIEI